MLVRYRKNSAVYAMKVLKKDSVLQRKQLEHTMTERQILQVSGNGTEPLVKTERLRIGLV
jgi:hypothetical protein